MWRDVAIFLRYPIREAHDTQLLLIRDVVWSPGHDTWFSYVALYFPLQLIHQQWRAHLRPRTWSSFHQSSPLDFSSHWWFSRLNDSLPHSCNSFPTHQPAFSCWVLSSLPLIYRPFLYFSSTQICVLLLYSTGIIHSGPQLYWCSSRLRSDCSW